MAEQEEAESYRRYVIGQLRMARHRAKLLIVEIDTIGKAITRNWIDPDDALAWLSVDAIALVQSEPAATIKAEAEPSADRGMVP